MKAETVWQENVQAIEMNCHQCFSQCLWNPIPLFSFPRFLCGRWNRKEDIGINSIFFSVGEKENILFERGHRSEIWGKGMDKMRPLGREREARKVFEIEKLIFLLKSKSWSFNWNPTSFVYYREEIIRFFLIGCKVRTGNLLSDFFFFLLCLSNNVAW